MEVDNEDGLGLLTLPSVVLLKIFSYLTQHDILHALAPACQDLYALSKRPNWHLKAAINHQTDKEQAKEFLKVIATIIIHLFIYMMQYSKSCVYVNNTHGFRYLDLRFT